MSARKARGSAARITICQRHLPRSRRRKQGAWSRANQVHAGAPAVYLAKSVLFQFGLVLYFPDDSLNLPNEHG